MKEPARFLKTPLSLLITDVLCSKKEICKILCIVSSHDHPPYCRCPWCCNDSIIIVYLSTVATWPCSPWPDEIGVIRKGRQWQQWLLSPPSWFRHSYLLWFPFMHTCARIWENATHRKLNFIDMKSETNSTVLCLIKDRTVQRQQKHD